MGAILLNGSKIGKNSLVGAGALVTEGKSFPDNSLIVGAPARAIRTLDEKAMPMIARRRRHLRPALAAIRQGLEADRLTSRISEKGAAGLGGGRPLANPVWGRGGVGT